MRLSTPSLPLCREMCRCGRSRGWSANSSSSAASPRWDGCCSGGCAGPGIRARQRVQQVRQQDLGLQVAAVAAQVDAGQDGLGVARVHQQLQLGQDVLHGAAAARARGPARSGSRCSAGCSRPGSSRRRGCGRRSCRSGANRNGCSCEVLHLHGQASSSPRTSGSQAATSSLAVLPTTPSISGTAARASGWVWA